MNGEKPYAHKCLCCGVFVSFDRTYCIACEKTFFGNGGVTNGEETIGDSDGSGNEPEEE